VSAADTGAGGPPQVAWIAIEQGAALIAADGSNVGTVEEIAGDESHDIFDGLVVSCPNLEGSRYVAAERVTGIWPDRVTTDLTTGEAAGLSPYTRLQTTEWHADDDRGFGARMRRAWHDLFGRHRSS